MYPKARLLYILTSELTWNQQTEETDILHQPGVRFQVCTLESNDTFSSLG